VSKLREVATARGPRGADPGCLSPECDAAYDASAEVL